MHRINLPQDEEKQRIKQTRVKKESKVDRLLDGCVIDDVPIDVGLIYSWRNTLSFESLT